MRFGPGVLSVPIIRLVIGSEICLRNGSIFIEENDVIRVIRVFVQVWQNSITKITIGPYFMTS